MILYHGSNVDIQNIDLSLCRPFKDFGKGFYTTQILEQAKKMALRVSKLYGGTPIVNEYEISDDFKSDNTLCIKDFGEVASDEWAKFVMNNRNRDFLDFKNVLCNFDCKYDIVIGSIANDDMAILFRQFENGLIDFETLRKGLVFKKMTSQISFHTERAIALLKKRDVK